MNFSFEIPISPDPNQGPWWGPWGPLGAPTPPGIPPGLIWFIQAWTPPVALENFSKILQSTGDLKLPSGYVNSLLLKMAQSK